MKILINTLRAAGAAVVLLGLAFASTAQTRNLPDFTELVAKHRTSVVNISTTQKQTTGSRPQLPKGFEIPDLPKDSPFNEFFRRFFGEEEMEEFDSQSLGSGFIISSDGYIISNNHVIKNADEVIVRLSDRREFNAKIIGADERSDIALLKIDAEDLPTARLGTDYNLKVGEWVLAIGSPFGFDYSVTAGIVSAKGRSLPRENYVPFIQTDVAINPGNSGGPLFNLDGEVVGVNSQIFSRTGGFMGLSFAIPIDVAMDVAEQLQDKGRVSRGWLGVLIQDVTRELAESFGMGKPGGALIAKVLPDSPAEGAGFQVGDVVLSFNEHEVKRSSDLPPIVGRTRVGKRVPVEVLRNGESRTLYVVTAELPEQEAVTQAAVKVPDTAEDNKLGLAVTDLTPEQREQMESKDHGVMVTEVTDGPARSAGIQKGDVVLMLNGVKVESSSDFKRLASELPAGKAVSILVQRQGNPIFLALKTEE
ncbi:MAG: Do family serine endopeptidase [Gammaproteobacteria bacterium]|jgi:serine protease Do|nr:Do family serine endopeptidase [Gammaproteobacteria bacterium]